MTKLYRINNEVLYLAAGNQRFNLTKRILNGQPVATLLRQWQNPESGVINWELFTMDYDVYSRDQVFVHGNNEPDVGKYLVY